ncbi:MAG: hypothetical protein WA988_03285 [Candidatus Nanopelagicales bacterium]
MVAAITFVPVAISLVFGFLALGVVANALSRSRSERLVMTPIAFVLAALSLAIALNAG